SSSEPTKEKGPGDSGSTESFVSAIEPRRGCGYYNAVSGSEKVFSPLRHGGSQLELRRLLVHNEIRKRRMPTGNIDLNTGSYMGVIKLIIEIKIRIMLATRNLAAPSFLTCSSLNIIRLPLVSVYAHAASRPPSSRHDS